MEITVDIGYEQLVAAIKKLPAAKIKQLKSALDEDIIREKAIGDISDFQRFLLAAPVMTTEQYEQHQADRKQFDKWRTK